MNNKFSQTIVSLIYNGIIQLPPEQREKAILDLLSDMVNQMPEKELGEMREQMVAQFDSEIPIIQSALNVIDGQLALREIAKL